MGCNERRPLCGCYRQLVVGRALQPLATGRHPFKARRPSRTLLPNQPAIARSGRCFRIDPPPQDWNALDELRDATRRSMLEQAPVSPGPFNKPGANQHRRASSRQVERAASELLCQAEGRIGNDPIGSIRFGCRGVGYIEEVERLAVTERRDITRPDASEILGQGGRHETPAAGRLPTRQGFRVSGDANLLH